MGHWIVEMGEMNAVANAKSIEETKAFLSRQKETYRIPYERFAEDRPGQCVFCGTSNDMSFLPLDRTGNRRFAPVQIHLKNGEKSLASMEEEARAYIIQMWAEAMVIYRSGDFRLTFSQEMDAYVRELQKSFMPEDIQAGMIQTFLDQYKDDYICTAIIYQEVFGQQGIPEKWKSKEIGDILENSITGWEKHGNHRFKSPIGTQRSWKRVEPQTDENGFRNFREDEDNPFEEEHVEVVES
jgi:predicted P-loop ATPase